MSHNAYPLAADVSALLTAEGITVTAAILTQLGSALNAAIAGFEAETEQQFVVGASATRYYDPPVTRESKLKIDPATSITAVVYQPAGSSAETLTARSSGVLGDYWLEPVNAAAKGRPYTAIRFRRLWYAPSGQPWNAGAGQEQSLAVTGTFGWPAVPDDVWFAIAQWAGIEGLLLAGGKQSAGVRSRSIEDFSVSYGDGPYKQQIERWAGSVREVRDRYLRSLV